MNSEEFKDRVLPLSNRIFRFARRILINDHDAEDVTQEIYLKLWDNRARLGTVKSIEAFTFRMTRNLCLDKLRRMKPEYYDDRETYAYRYDEADAAPDPGASLEGKDTMEKINLIIGQLPEQQRTLLQLRDVEGLEYGEISGITGMEINAIRVGISRARRKVRESIQKARII